MRRYRSRASQRSRASTVSEVDPREKIKDCCRQFVAFMCSQVGVGALIVCYTIVGAFGFSKMEAGFNDTDVDIVKQMRTNYTGQMWYIASTNNVVDRDAFYRETNMTLFNFQKEMVGIIKRGYDGRDPAQKWTFPAALMFSLSIVTMIGYGNLVPRTGWGKLATVVYAVFGIPLYVLYFLNVGAIMAECFKSIYTWLYECTRRKGQDRQPKRIVVPSAACLWVIGAYILTGTIMFAEWESWSYPDSTYFCVTSLCKLGLGDFVPGTASKNGSASKLVINFIYILIGLGLVAMCYNLMREQIRIKVQEFKEDFRQCLEDSRLRMLQCCSSCRRKDY